MLSAPELKRTTERLGLKDWSSSLSERDTVRMERYADPKAVSPYQFLLSAGSASLDEENYEFSSAVLEECLRRASSDMQVFDVTELLIDAYIGSKRYDEAKQQCEKNLSLYPGTAEQIKGRNNGVLPEKLNCRNRYIDVVVGVESGYDEAFRLLDRFLDMGLISKEDHAFRTQSLKIHRLQRSFDGVYTYTYKN